MDTLLLLTVITASFAGTIADPLRLTVHPQYRMIGLPQCIIAFQGHPRSMIYISFESQYATSY